MKTSLMLKLSSIAILSSSLLFGANSDEKILGFIKNSIRFNNGYSIKNVSIKSTKSIEQMPNWKAYFIDISLHVEKQNKDIDISDVVFSNGKFFAKDLMNLDTKSSLKNEISPDINTKLYTKEHLIAGNINAKNRLLVFSDPVCPYCIDFVPDVIEVVKKHPNDLALYYYHLPLRIHQSALGMTKAMIVAKKQGFKDIELKVYNKNFKSKIGDDNTIAKVFNEAFKTKITPKQMNEKWVTDKIQNDMKKANEFNIHGTPTIFVNGKKDTTRANYRALVNKL